MTLNRSLIAGFFAGVAFSGVAIAIAERPFYTIYPAAEITPDHTAGYVPDKHKIELIGLTLRLRNSWVNYKTSEDLAKLAVPPKPLLNMSDAEMKAFLDDGRLDGAINVADAAYVQNDQFADNECQRVFPDQGQALKCQMEVLLLNVPSKE